LERDMRKFGLFGAAVAVACIAASGAAASPADPTPGTPDCGGHLIAVSNGASGHGPGYYMHSGTDAGIVEYQYEVCTLGLLP